MKMLCNKKGKHLCAYITILDNSIAAKSRHPPPPPLISMMGYRIYAIKCPWRLFKTWPGRPNVCLKPASISTPCCSDQFNYCYSFGNLSNVLFEVSMVLV